jgi:predicted short-subunit dehydrogenase-like oxidoreductase (DUF2520 family)
VVDRRIEGEIGIIGGGRAGTGLALALGRAEQGVALLMRRASPLPKPLRATVMADGPDHQWLTEHPVLLLAVPDDAIRALAESLARTKAIGPDHVVLHLSGVLGQEALAPLVSSRAALGSLHPLQTFADPTQAPDRLRGAWAAVEGTPRAVEVGEQVAALVGLRPFRITGKAKALYHASAVFASNYLVVVEAVAQRLLRHTGLSDADAWAALRPLVEGTVATMMRGDPRDALTGPVARGDAETIVKHLNALTIDDAKLYQSLGRAALELARKRGMDEGTAQRVADALATDLPPVLPKGE